MKGREGVATLIPSEEEEIIEGTPALRAPRNLLFNKVRVQDWIACSKNWATP